jgi:hypothetical protein
VHMTRATRAGSIGSSRTARVTAPPREPLVSNLECAECGRLFARAAALGAHRRRAHGVVGTSRTAVVSRGRIAGGAGVDRDALLGLVFPNGIPAREEVLRATNRWLAQAERLVAISR